mgnify:CR=1 FL=1
MNINQYENAGLKALTKILGQCDRKIELIPTKQSCRFDAHLISESNHHIVEIKTRSMPSDRYKAWFLEESKRDAMTRIVEDKGYDKSFYLNVFTDDIALLWEISEIPEHYQRKSLYMSASTASNIGASYKKEKKVILLPSKNAYKYTI